MRQFDIYAPLQDFVWAGAECSFSPSVVIKRFDSPPDVSGLDSYVSKPEWNRAIGSTHWVVHQWVDGAEPSPSAVINLVLLSLWLVKPTRAQVTLRFQIGREEAWGEKTMSRILDRFAWIPGTIEPDISDEQVGLASSYYSALEFLCRSGGRLNNAMVLTVAGCWSHGWQTALICHAAAAETILTYATGRGLMRRLATSYACLVETDKADRDLAYKEFVALYSVRSDIVHGRMHNIDASQTLSILFRLQNLMRRLWRVVLTSKSLELALEGGDADREFFLKQVENGYVAPK